ncbi:NAD(P)/FAD-dependent oxidoreductase [Acinetobacter sp. B10A]|uniref:NAD(P)/FAD-dependent oxidoreductase n=1 Tax=Acinetobacter baretiae TaxID=2605383 RepID=UPI001B3C92A2|nr:FAD/NAD(P)-binding oxidoreductase [Acinetobacter baretiae]MBF7685602.1 NAD(P)/FAD-dependent oxidoreductase [Acinetobacter baretiae]
MKTHYHIIIIGAGPAGLNAAISAAQSAQSIAIFDDNIFAGGQIWRNGPRAKLPLIAQKTQAIVADLPHVDLIQSVKVIAVIQPKILLVEHAGQSLQIHYDKIIICTGGRELFLPFPGWTLPGVTGAGALQALIKAGLDVKNKKIVISGTGPLLLASAQTAKKAGAHVIFIAEQTPYKQIKNFAFQLWRWPKKILQAIFMPIISYHTDSFVIEAQGNHAIQSVTIHTPKGIKTIDCDYLACGYGIIANTQVASLLGANIKETVVHVDEMQQTSLEDIFAAGECTGFGGSELSIVEGQIAGYAAIGDTQRAQQLFAQRAHDQKFSHLLKTTFTLRAEVKRLATSETIFCRCEDVTLAQVIQHKDWYDTKLQTRCGMGACQGRICAASATCLFGWDTVKTKVPLSPIRTKSLIEMLTQQSK